MANIYQLTSVFHDLQSMLECADEDTTEAIKNTLLSVGGEAVDAVEQAVRLIKNIESDIAGLCTEIDRISHRKKQLDNQVDSVRNAIKILMEVAKYDKVKTQLFTVTLAEGRESVLVSDDSLLPDEFVVVKTSINPDKAAIAEAIKAGKEVAGATMVTGEKSLRIK